MKTSEEPKKELHEYIDSIHDEETLMMVLEDVSAYIKINPGKKATGIMR